MNKLKNDKKISIKLLTLIKLNIDNALITEDKNATFLSSRRISA